MGLFETMCFASFHICLLMEDYYFCYKASKQFKLNTQGEQVHAVLPVDVSELLFKAALVTRNGQKCCRAVAETSCYS